MYLARFEDHLYRLFVGQESKRAWKMFNERQPTTLVPSPQVWLESSPHESTFFTPQSVRNPIDRLQFGKAQDRDGLVGDHFIYARDTLLPLLAHIFNRTMCEGFPTRWT